MKISHLFNDPLVKALCEAAEREEGDEAASDARTPILPVTGHACHPERAAELEAA